MFSHNDVHEGNILYQAGLKASQRKLTMIDFEYGGYNHRSFDIANHFCEWMYCYDVKTAPYYVYNYEHWPSDRNVSKAV